MSRWHLSEEQLALIDKLEATAEDVQGGSGDCPNWLAVQLAEEALAFIATLNDEAES